MALNRPPGRRRSPPAVRPIRPILALDCARLRPLAELHEPFTTVFHPWDELIEAAHDAPPTATIAVDPAAAPAEPMALIRLVTAAGMAPVLAAVDMRGATEAELRALFAAGVTEVLDAEMENRPAAAGALLASVRAGPLKRLLETGLSRFVSFDALTLIRAAAEVTVDGGGAEEMSDLFDSQERTVSGWCAREALPPPRRLLAWLRLILALALLANPERRVGRAAEAAGYTDHSLRRALRAFLGGGKPTRGWTVADALAAFNAELAALRERRRAPQRAAPPAGRR
jgi:AraC-like DNA-binding protein